MSKLGRRKKNAYLGRKKALREMIEGLVFLALALFFCVGIFMEEYPAAEDLKEYTGVYRELETRRFGRRSRAYGLAFEDGADFYIHPNFKEQEFLDAVSPGDVLHILSADIRRPWSLYGDLNGVVFEMRTADGLKLRDYDSTIKYLKENAEVRVMLYGILGLSFVALAVFSFRDWKRYKIQYAQLEEQKRI